MKPASVIAKSLGITYPVIQAPMLGVTTPQMVAAVTNAGGLGSLPVGGLSPDQTRELIRQTKSLTNKTFSVNFFAHQVPDYSMDDALAMQDFLEKLCRDHNIPFERQDISAFKFYTYEDQIEILISENIPFVSFTFGIIDEASVKALHAANILIGGSATSLKEGDVLTQLGIDIICAQGIEAGGHRGTFIEDEPLPMIGTLSLVTQLVNRTKKPVIAAGGIADGRSIRAAFEMGADAVQIGTAFVASEESLGIPSYKAALQEATDTDAQLTRAFSGRWARGLNNRFMAELEKSGLKIPPYPVQNSLTTALRAAARKLNNKDLINLWAGQSAFLAKQKPSAEIFTDLVKDAKIFD